MLPQPATSRPTLAPPPWAPVPPADGAPAARLALLEAIEGLQPHRVLVMGDDALEILCALIRIGCDAASELRASERPEWHCADMVVATAPKGWPNLQHLLTQASRALVQGGGLVLQVTGPAAETRARHAGLRLRRAGFAEARVATAADGAILVARLPEPGAQTIHA